MPGTPSRSTAERGTCATFVLHSVMWQAETPLPICLAWMCAPSHLAHPLRSLRTTRAGVTRPWRRCPATAAPLNKGSCSCTRQRALVCAHGKQMQVCFRSGNGNGSCFHVRLFLMATDQGGDQRGAHRLIECELAQRGDGFTVMLRQWCVEHIIHLIVKKQLAQTPRCWSIVAMTVNTRRTGGNVSKLHRRYVELTSQVSSDRLLLK